MLLSVWSFGNDDKRNTCFSKHSQLPPESFHPARLESLCWLILSWMSDAPFELFIRMNTIFHHRLCLFTLNLEFDMISCSHFKITNLCCAAKIIAVFNSSSDLIINFLLLRFF
jgi:hypothetical protein